MDQNKKFYKRVKGPGYPCIAELDLLPDCYALFDVQNRNFRLSCAYIKNINCNGKNVKIGWGPNDKNITYEVGKIIYPELAPTSGNRGGVFAYDNDDLRRY